MYDTKWLQIVIDVDVNVQCLTFTKLNGQQFIVVNFVFLSWKFMVFQTVVCMPERLGLGTH